MIVDANLHSINEIHTMWNAYLITCIYEQMALFVALWDIKWVDSFA